MATIFIVAKHPKDRDLIDEILVKHEEWRLYWIESLEQVQSELQEHCVDLLIVDSAEIQDSGDLSFISRFRDHYANLPILLISPVTHDEVVVQALMLGAASYVAKNRLARDLTASIERLLAMTSRDTAAQLPRCLDSSATRMVFENDRRLIPVVVQHMQEVARNFGFCHRGERFRLGVALDEALLNAVVHGNLEIDSAVRESDDDRYEALIEQRLQAAPYRDRKVTLEARLQQGAVEFTISDQGPGFNPAEIPDPRLPENRTKSYGRGLVLMRAFMDSVEFNDLGNQVILKKSL